MPYIDLNQMRALITSGQRIDGHRRTELNRAHLVRERRRGRAVTGRVRWIGRRRSAFYLKADTHRHDLRQRKGPKIGLKLTMSMPRLRSALIRTTACGAAA